MGHVELECYTLGVGVAISFFAGVNPFGVDIDFFLEIVYSGRIFDTAHATFHASDIDVALNDTVHGLVVSAERTVEDLFELGCLLLWRRLCGSLALAHLEVWVTV